MAMQGRTVLAVIPGAGPLERLELALSQRANGRLVFELREQHHAEGLGWYDQRGFELDPAQLRQIQAVVGQWSAGVLKTPDFDPEEAPASIPFPGPTGLRLKRAAVGE